MFVSSYIIELIFVVTHIWHLLRMDIGSIDISSCCMPTKFTLSNGFKYCRYQYLLLIYNISLGDLCDIYPMLLVPVLPMLLTFLYPTLYDRIHLILSYTINRRLILIQILLVQILLLTLHSEINILAADDFVTGLKNFEGY